MITNVFKSLAIAFSLSLFLNHSAIAEEPSVLGQNFGLSTEATVRTPEYQPMRKGGGPADIEPKHGFFAVPLLFIAIAGVVLYFCKSE